MKNLTEFIFEHTGNTPDGVTFMGKGRTRGEDYYFNYSDDSARAFIFYKGPDVTFIGDNENVYHNDIMEDPRQYCPNAWKKLSKEQKQNFKDLYEHQWDYIRQDNAEKVNTPVNQQKANVKASKKVWDDVDNVLLGRLWLNEVTYSLHPDKQYMMMVAWWPALSSKDMHYATKKVVEYYLDSEQISIDTVSIFCVDNTGKIFEFNPNEVTEIKGRSKEDTKLVKSARAIHLATQQEKREFFAAFRKNRDEKNQEIYNHTPSHTEAEWRSIRYQGDSLEDDTKPIED